MTSAPRDPGDLRLSHHHIGGRAGDTGFNLPAVFEPGVVRVLYDADAGAAEQIQEKSDSWGRTTITRPYFIGLPGTTKSFMINYCPYTSSVRRIDPRFASYHVEVDGTDYVLGEVTRPLRTIEIESRGLDELIARERDLPAPDLLSIDAEGGEDDILEGARELLDHRVVAVMTEVKFNPVYSDGPTFGDLSAALFARGFVFVEFEHLARFAPMRGRLGTRGRGMITSGDAIFFKDPAAIRGTPGERALKLRKLAFAALCRAQLEFAQLCLGMLPEGTPVPADAPAYLRFVDQFQRLCALAPDIMPWQFNEAYSAERSEIRFRTAVPEEERQRIGAETQGRAIREAGKIERMTADLGRATAAQAMAQLFERHGLGDAARIIVETQKDKADRYLSSVVEKVKYG